MPAMKMTEQTNNLADQAAVSADQAIKATQRATNNAFDSLAGTVQDVRQQAAPLLDKASAQVSAIAQRGVDTVRETSQQLRERAMRASDGTVNYIKDEPVKAMLISAAIGAGLMALINLLSRNRA